MCWPAWPTWRMGSGRPGCPAWTSQAIDALLPQFAAATVDSVELGGDLVTFRVRVKAGDVACSGCRRRSSRVHARYQRQLADLPLGGRRVRVIAQIRRFKCVNSRCPQSTFSGQIPGLTTPFARHTPPLTEALVR